MHYPFQPINVPPFRVSRGYATAPAYDLSYLKLLNTIDLSAYLDTYSSKPWVNSAGNKLFVIGYNAGSARLISGTLSTAFDLSTFTHSETAAYDANYRWGLSLSNNGEMLFLVNVLTGYVKKYSLTIPFNITLHTTLQTVYFYPEILDLFVTINGDKVASLMQNTLNINSFNLTTAFDLSTKTSQTTKNFSSTYPRSFWLNSDGQYLFVMGSDVIKKLFKYYLTTPYDISTATLKQSVSLPAKCYGIYCIEKTKTLYIFISLDKSVYLYSIPI